MKKPYIILHMMTSLDGKITGDFLNYGDALGEDYYRINREYKADAFCCGRITMEGSFTQGKQPDLAPFAKAMVERVDHVAKQADYYAVSIDPHGKLGWYGDHIDDYDPGYDKAHIIEVLTDKVSDSYLAFLQSKGISYIFCGNDKVDVNVMNDKLANLFGIKTLMLEGGGLTDTLFLDADVIDEISLVVSPTISNGGIDLFANKNCSLAIYKLQQTQQLSDNGLWLNYKK